MIEQRLAIGGPLDGRIIQVHQSPAPAELPLDGGAYVRWRLSENVAVYHWKAATDRWARRKRTVQWGVPKRPFGR